MADEEYGIKVNIGADDSDFQKVITETITGLGDITDSFDKMTNENKQAFADLANQFQAIDAKAKIWGDDSDVVADKQEAVKEAINKLISEGIDPASKQIQELKKSYDELASSDKSEVLEKSFASLRDIMQGPVEAAKLVIEALKGIAEQLAECTKEYAEDEEATLKFNSAIDASNVLTGEAKKRLEELAIATAKATGETNAQAESQIAALVATGRNDEQIKRMVDTAKGMAATLPISFDAALSSLNKTFDGVKPRIEGVKGITSDLTAAQLKNGDAIDIINKAYGKFANTLDGDAKNSLAASTNAWGEFRGAIGGIADTFIKPIRDEITKLVTGLTDWINKSSGIKTVLSILFPILTGVVAGLIVFVATLAIGPIIAVASAAIGVLTTALAGMGIALGAATGGISLAIAALVAGALLVIQHWDTVSDAFKTLFAYIVFGVETAAGKLSSVFIIAFNLVKTAMLTFAQVYADTVLSSISNLLKMASNIPGIGGMFKSAAAGVDSFKSSIDKSIQASKDESMQAIDTANKATIAAKSRLDYTLQSIQNEKTFREAANKKDIDGQKKTELAKQGQTADTVAYQDAQNAKASQSYIDSLNKQKSAAIDLAEKKEESVEEVVAIAKDYDNQELTAYTEMIESERKVALAEANKKGADADTIANINQQYNDKITTYEQTQLTAREKLNTDYTKNLEAKIKERADFELKWAKQGTTDKQTQLDLQYAADIAKAKKLITNETELNNTLLNIDKKYAYDSKQVALDKLKTIAGYGKSVISSVGGDGAEVLNNVITSTTDVATAAASGFTNIQADLAGLTDIIGLAGDADKKKFAELQEKLADIAAELLDAMAPVLDLILDILIDLMPILEDLMPIIKDIFDIIEPFLPIIMAIVTVGLFPLTASLKIINAVLQEMKKFLEPVRVEFQKFGEWAKDAGDNLIKGFTDGITNAGVAIWNNVKHIFTGFWDSVCNFFGIHSPSTLFADMGENIIQGLINGLLSAGSSLWNAVSGIFTGLWDNITNVFSGAMDLGSSIISGISSGISGLTSSIGDTISNVASGIGSFFGFANGTDSAPGGYAIVGEQGPELVNLPRGTSVTPAGKTADLLNGLNKSGTSSNEYNFTINAGQSLSAAQIAYEVKKQSRAIAAGLVS